MHRLHGIGLTGPTYVSQHVRHSAVHSAVQLYSCKLWQAYLLHDTPQGSGSLMLQWCAGQRRSSQQGQSPRERSGARLQRRSTTASCRRALRPGPSELKPLPPLSFSIEGAERVNLGFLKPLFLQFTSAACLPYVKPLLEPVRMLAAMFLRTSSLDVRCSCLLCHQEQRPDMDRHFLPQWQTTCTTYLHSERSSLILASHAAGACCATRSSTRTPESICWRSASSRARPRASRIARWGRCCSCACPPSATPGCTCSAPSGLAR